MATDLVRPQPLRLSIMSEELWYNAKLQDISTQAKYYPRAKVKSLANCNSVGRSINQAGKYCTEPEVTSKPFYC